MSNPNTTELQRITQSAAHAAGFADGQSWDYDLEAVRVDGWAEDTLKARGAREFGRHIGLSDAEVEERGEAWSAACAEYNRGCVDGVTAARTERATASPR